MNDRINNILSHTRKKPWWFRLVPGLWGSYANTICPWIYLNGPEWADIHSTNPKSTTIATLLHEAVHFERQREIGVFKYGFTYLCSRTFRFEEELAAIKPQMKYVQDHGMRFDTEDRARKLSSSMYLWCATYEEAKRRLEKMFFRSIDQL